jgi:hypothetical protein
MTKIASMTGIARGTVIGKQVSGPPLSEADHFFKFEMCGDWFDMRDLGAVLDHEQPLPHPACDQVQEHHETALGLMHRGQGSHERGRQLRAALLWWR